MDIRDDEDGFPYGTSIWAALGLSTPSGCAVMGTLVACWVLELRWWALLLVPLLALPVGILALPALRRVRGRRAVMMRVGGIISRRPFKSTSAWLAFRFYDTVSVVSAIVVGGTGAGWWALVPFTLLAIVGMRWIWCLPASMIAIVAVGVVQYSGLPLRP